MSLKESSDAVKRVLARLGAFDYNMDYGAVSGVESRPSRVLENGNVYIGEWNEDN